MILSKALSSMSVYVNRIAYECVSTSVSLLMSNRSASASIETSIINLSLRSIGGPHLFTNDPSVTDRAEFFNFSEEFRQVRDR